MYSNEWSVVSVHSSHEPENDHSHSDAPMAADGDRHAINSVNRTNDCEPDDNMSNDDDDADRDVNDHSDDDDDDDAEEALIESHVCLTCSHSANFLNFAPLRRVFGSTVHSLAVNNSVIVFEALTESRMLSQSTCTLMQCLCLQSFLFT